MAGAGETHCPSPQHLIVGPRRVRSGPLGGGVNHKWRAAFRDANNNTELDNNVPCVLVSKRRGGDRVEGS